MMTLEEFREHARTITPEELKSLGVDRVCYIKPIEAANEKGEKVPAFAIFDADGSEMAQAASKGIAERMAEANERQLVTVH